MASCLIVHFVGYKMLSLLVLQTRWVVRLCHSPKQARAQNVEIEYVASQFDAAALMKLGLIAKTMVAVATMAAVETVATVLRSNARVLV